MKRIPKHLYHWTHRKNLHSIMRKGLCIRYATGNLSAVWMCESGSLAWALGHVAHGHKWNADSLVCIRIRTKRVRITRSGISGAYTSRADVKSDAIDGILFSLVDAFQEV